MVKLGSGAPAAAVATFTLLAHPVRAFFAIAPIAPPASPGLRAIPNWRHASPLGTRGGGGVGSDAGGVRGAGSSLNMVAKEELRDSTQCRHFYGYGDPDHVPSILQEITAQRYRDVAEAKTKVSKKELRKQIEEFDKTNGGTLDLYRRIAAEEPEMAIAAEFKRASPSKGDIAVGLNAGEQGLVYASVGATVLSVLTEPKWFKGSLDDMKEVRLATQDVEKGKAEMRPAILRKDFIVDEYQLLEARANGADTVLLIVAILELDLLDDLIYAARELKMEPLVEVHTNEEMRIALSAGARVVGVNNRNLHTFELDLKTTERVARVAIEMGVPWQLPSSGYEKERIILSALSGITGPEDVQRFSNIGVAMVLVGETLMRADDPGRSIRVLLGKEDPLPVSERRVIKVCGVTNVEDALAAAAAGVNLIGVIFAEGSPRRIDTARAREITTAVQKFGERNERMSFDPPPKTDSSRDWFTAWSVKLLESTQRTPLVVGVFQNQPMEEVQRIVEEAALDMVQLHGDEGMEACAECGVPALRVVHVPASGQPREVGADEGEEGDQDLSLESRVQDVLHQLPPNYAAGVVLDTTVKGMQGGTGATFDHEVAKLVGEAGVPVIVAGGLSADNVEICIMSTSSYGVDVSSGVERSKGIKDPVQLERFVREARLAQKDLNR